ncbi:hypothetical protein JTE90_019792 [Oedothorax gibbosus]|uniref:DM domain-containing protein n=1 Tax=Oedothorax gibbosus TaxID=931172 RepID=A0AAV6V6L5_9ARAC|nr:hypothetical protein JTE90_019792 [Oedothorax gibbosus]
MHPKQLHNYNMQKGGVGEHCHEKAWYIQENMVTADKEFHGYAYPKSDEVVEHAKEMYYQQSPKEESRHEYSRKKPRKTRHCVEGSDLVEITKNDSVMEHEEILYQQSSKKRRHELDEYPHNEPGKTMHRGKNSLPRETAENPQVPPGKKPQRRVRYAKGTSSGQKKSLPPQPLQTLDNSTVVMANGDLNLPEVIKDDTLPDDEVSNEEKKVTRQPKCAKCKNHHIDVLVKGHKHFCPYKKCNCKLCEIVKNRQDIMKRQISLTRYQKEVEARKLRARILRARILRAKQLQLVGIQKDEVEQLEAQELEAEQLEAQEEDIEQVEVPEENEEASLDVVGISSGNVTPEPKHASAFATSQAKLDPSQTAAIYSRSLKARYNFGCGGAWEKSNASNQRYPFISRSDSDGETCQPELCRQSRQGCRILLLSRDCSDICRPKKWHGPVAGGWRLKY